MSYMQMLSRDNKDHEIKIDNDFFPTPPDATHALMNLEDFEGHIWEPACGDGAMSEVIKEYHRPVFVRSTDLIDRGYGVGGVDFLTQDHRSDHIVTNPPYKLAEQFVRKAIELSDKKVAMLVRLMFLESMRRYPMFQAYPPKTVYVFSYRLKFWPAGFKKPISTVPYAWFVWDKEYQGDTIIKWIPKPQEAMT